MKKITGILVLYASLLLAPPEGFDFEDSDTSEKSKKTSKSARQKEQSEQRSRIAKPKEASERSFAKKSAEIKSTQVSGIHLGMPHEPVKQFDGRSNFEQALKTGDLDSAREMISKIRDSHVTTEEFLQHLKETYDSTQKITSLYPGKSADQAREALMKDLDEINPHLAKTFRDVFKVKKPVEQPQARNDDAYFDWLGDNPEQITHPAVRLEPTPLEIAVNQSSREMGKRIVEIAKKNKIKSLDIVDPLINTYKNIMKTKGADAAYEYVQKVYDLGIDRISKIFHDHISKIDFLVESKTENKSETSRSSKKSLSSEFIKI